MVGGRKISSLLQSYEDARLQKNRESSGPLKEARGPNGSMLLNKCSSEHLDLRATSAMMSGNCFKLLVLYRSEDKMSLMQ
ncbi:hypothetical protein ACET3Z_010982 [Daucus carota]